MKVKKIKYTLIELLAVMAISIILLAIAIPAFNSLTKGNKVEIAARTIGSQLKAVRSHAITNREYIAFIIPTENNPSGLSTDYYYKSYRICIVNSSSVFQEWVSGEKWEFMPTGTAILDVDDTLSHPDTGAGAFDSATPVTSVDFSVIGGGTTSSSGIVFTPTGKTVGARKYVAVGDAILLESGVTTTSDYIEITIDTYSGRISYGSD